MFTGIIEEIGILSGKIKTGDVFQLKIDAGNLLSDLQPGSSISINGCCLTVVKKTSGSFFVDVIEETLKKTNLGELNINDRINLELSLKPNGRLDGHFVLGHVDATGKIEKIKKLSNSYVITISFPGEFNKFLIRTGSVSVDGISLTIAGLFKNSFKVGIIPHTWEQTILKDKKEGYSVNLEFDVLGKYVERILEKKA